MRGSSFFLNSPMKTIPTFNLIFFSLLCISCAFAALPPQSEVDRPKNEFLGRMEASLTAYFKGINALSYKASIKRKIDKWILENPERMGNSLNGPQEGAFSVEICGNKYCVDDKSHLGPEGEKFRNLTAYDGEKYQYLSYPGGRLFIKTVHSADEKPNEQDIRSADPFFHLFEFCSEGFTGHGGFLSMHEFGSGDCVKAALLRVVSVELPATPGDYACIEFKTRQDYPGQLPTTFRVKFATDPIVFPMGWQMLDKEKHLLASLDVTELGAFSDRNGEIFKYPKRIDYSTFSGLHHIATITTEFKEFSVNQPPSSEGAFTIDPALAQEVWDADKKVMIQVPR